MGSVRPKKTRTPEALRGEPGSVKIDYEDPYTWTKKHPGNSTFALYHDVDYPVDYFTENDMLPVKFPEDWITEDMYKPNFLNMTRDDGSHKVSRKRSAMARKHEYDPNVVKLDKRKNSLTWNNVRVNLIGTDDEGRQIISISKGAGEPIWIRFSTTQTEVRKAGKKAKWE